MFCSQLPVKNHMSTVYVKCHMYVDDGQKGGSLVVKRRVILLSCDLRFNQLCRWISTDVCVIRL